MLQISIHSKFFIDKGIKKDILSEIKLDLKRGHFYSILGSSGIGKTTLLKIIAGIDTDFDGTVKLNSPNSEPIRTSMIFQEHRLLPWQTVEDNLKFVLPKAMSNEEKNRKIERILSHVGLHKSRHSWVKSLSGGMAQRVSIARALIVEPNLLLLDEPFSSLDQFTKRDMMKRLKKIIDLQKLTCIMVTHDFDESIYLSDTIGILAGIPAHLDTTRTISIDNRDNWASTDFNYYRAWLEEIFFKR